MIDDKRCDAGIAMRFVAGVRRADRSGIGGTPDIVAARDSMYVGPGSCSLLCVLVQAEATALPAYMAIMRVEVRSSCLRLRRPIGYNTNRALLFAGGAHQSNSLLASGSLWNACLRIFSRLTSMANVMAASNSWKVSNSAYTSKRAHICKEMARHTLKSPSFADRT